MSKDRVRLIIGLLVIGTHILAFFGIVVWQSKYIPSGSERLDVAMLLVPVSAGYFVAVVRSAIQDLPASGPPKSLNYVSVVMLVTLAFSVALLYFVFSYPAVVGPTIIELRRWLVVLEIGFGSGFGLIAEDLFGKVEKVMVPQTDDKVRASSQTS